MAHFQNGNIIVADGKLVDGVDVSVLNTTVSTISTNYIPKDGTVSFTSPQSGVTPTLDAHLTTKGYVDGLLQGLDWQESVKDRFDPTSGLPGSPITGDRYISTATSNGWTINYIYEYNGSSWDAIIPNEGYATFVEDEDQQYNFNGSSWVLFGSTTTHNNLSGLQGGTTDQYYHLTLTQHTDLTDSGDSTLHYHSTDRNLSNATGTLPSGHFNDSSHGSLSGGSLHSVVVAGTSNGFMLASDKTKLDTYQSSGDSYVRSDADDSITANTNWGTNYKARFGDSQNMDMYSAGTNNFITVASGYFNVLAGGNYVFQGNATTGQSVLFYANTTKLRTLTTGVEILGTMAANTVTGANVTSGSDPGHTHTSASISDIANYVTSNANDVITANTTWNDGYKVQVGTGNDLQIYHDGTNNYIKSINGFIYLGLSANIIEVNSLEAKLNYNGSTKLTTASNGVTVTGYVFSDGVRVGDSELIEAGASADLQLYHNGTNSYVKNNTGILFLTIAGSETGIAINPNGSCDLYYDNILKFQTTSTGASVTGDFSVSGNLSVTGVIDGGQL